MQPVNWIVKFTNVFPNISVMKILLLYAINNIITHLLLIWSTGKVVFQSSVIYSLRVRKFCSSIIAVPSAMLNNFMTF